MAEGPPGRRWLPWVGLAASLLVVAVVVGLLVLSHREGDVSDPTTAFRETETQAAPARGAVQTPPKVGHPADDGFKWPIFGLDLARTRVLPLRTPFRPPFRVAWRVHTGQLLEFNPVLCQRSLYVLGDDGDLYKITRWGGNVVWKRKLGDLAASSPACSGGRVYDVLLRAPGSSVGRVVALDTRRGHVLWSHPLPARAESSPLLVRGRLFFGDEGGNVYAYDAHTGRRLWHSRVSGAVKGSLALSHGRLYVGTYGGSVYALGRHNGHVVWRNRVAGGGAFGAGGGNFYGGPAVEYGRVYVGATNGAVYSLDAATGRLAWRRQTGAYVYASAAVGAVGGGRPTVWIGSYNGNFYAFDARSGATRWSRHLGGKISGAATVLGNTVFVSSYSRRRSWALNANTGRILWSRPRGAFTPAISDGRRIYFNGHSTLFALDPRGRRFVSPEHVRALRRARALRAAHAARRRAEPRARHPAKRSPTKRRGIKKK